MIRWLMMASFALVGVQPVVKKAAVTVPVDAPSYTAEGQLKFPVAYREWVFLASGLDMSYTSKTPGDHSMFNNVFVNPSAYREFMKSGTWPEGTMFMLENRGAEGNHSINVRGKTQSAEVMGTEVHVKDSTHGGWAFYAFDDGDRKAGGSARLIPRAATCYSCHEQHGAVDTTFSQFYPTVLGVATEKGVLSKEYLKEMAGAEAAPVAK